MGLFGLANRNDEPTPRICKPVKSKVPGIAAEQSKETEVEVTSDSEHTAEPTESMCVGEYQKGLGNTIRRK